MGNEWSDMSNIVYDELEKRDVVFFARILPNNGYYKVLDLSIVSIHKKYCTGTDLTTKQTFLLDKETAEEVLFKNKKDALRYLNSRKNDNK